MEVELKCKKCGTHFPMEDLVTRTISGCYESDYGVYNQFNTHNHYEYEVNCCPNCGVEDKFVNVYMCEECYKFKECEEIVDPINGVCCDCMKKYTKEQYFKKYPNNDVGDWYE